MRWILPCLGALIAGLVLAGVPTGSLKPSAILGVLAFVGVGFLLSRFAGRATAS